MNKIYIFTAWFITVSLVSAAQTAPAIQWQKSLGGSGYDGTCSIEQTSDGGYIVAGESNSNDGDISGNHGNTDCWVGKLNSIGALEWQKSLGGSAVEQAFTIEQTADGGYIIAGYSESNDGDVSGNHGGGDCWIVRLNSVGAIQWQKCLGGSDFELDCAIKVTKDQGFIILGSAASADGDQQGGRLTLRHPRVPSADPRSVAR